MLMSGNVATGKGVPNVALILLRRIRSRISGTRTAFRMSNVRRSYRELAAQGWSHRRIARRTTPSWITGLVGHHQLVSVGFKPPACERQRRLEHVRHLWQMQRPQAILTAALFGPTQGMSCESGSAKRTWFTPSCRVPRPAARPVRRRPSDPRRRRPQPLHHRGPERSLRRNSGRRRTPIRTKSLGRWRS